MNLPLGRVLVLFLTGLLLQNCASSQNRKWWQASRESAGLAPSPAEHEDAIVQVYVARAFSWRGFFGVHPWIAYKPKGASAYRVLEVHGWRLRRGLTTVRHEEDVPDRFWYGEKPELIDDIRGNAAEAAIVKIQDLVQEYPYMDTYRVWPGPNSNTFIAYILRNTDELTIELPSHAVGKDYLPGLNPFAKTAAGWGGQFSLFGIFGLTICAGSGIEANLLGATFGVDFWTPALKLPIVGRLGFTDRGL